MRPEGIVGVGLNEIASRWWTFVVRGLVAIAFGVLVIVQPGISLIALVYLWGVYAIADGVFNLVLAFRGSRAVRGGWGWVIFEGIASIAAGVIAFIWPGITALALLILIALWAIATGVAEIVTATQLRKYIRGEWVLALSGVLSIVFGVLLLVRPGAGALTVVWLIGLYAILFGILLVGLGVRVHRWDKGAERPMPTGGAPSHA